MLHSSSRSRHSLSKSPSLTPDRPQNDDVEAQKSVVKSPNTGSKQQVVSVVSIASPMHRTPVDVLPGTLFDGARSPENQVPCGSEPKSRTKLVHVATRQDPLQATGPTSISLSPSIESLTQCEGHDGESASRGSGPYSRAKDNEDVSPSKHELDRTSVVDEDHCSARNERPASATRPRSPTAGHNELDKKEPTEEASDPWTECANRLWEYEENRVDKWKEDIGNLLIFSGLFSAILTSFIVPYYVLLQAQQPDASAQALVVISSQLAAISAQLSASANSAVHLNVTQPTVPSAATLSPIPPTPRTIISTCTLWYMALICSLGAALIAIMVSQWLHHHGDRTTSTSRQSIRIWYFRDRGFVQWKVQSIVDTLPLLLQLSVVLFLVGLIQLLWTMNSVVAGVVTVLGLALLTFSVGTVLIPAFAPKCPYKSPQAWCLLLILRWLTKHLERVSVVFQHFHDKYDAQEYLLRHMWNSLSLPLRKRSFWTDMPVFSGWRDLEYFLVRSQAEEDKAKLTMMVHADEILTDETSLPDIISPCVTESDLNAALPAFYAIMQRRAHETRPSDDPDQPDLIWYKVDSDGQLVVALGDMAIDMFARVTSADVYSRQEAEQLRILKIMNHLLHAMRWTKPGAAVYLRLCALADVAHLSDDVRKKLAESIVHHRPKFEGDIKDIRPMISAIASFQDLNPDKFSSGVGMILYCSAWLPRAEFERIRDELQGALTAVAEYFGRPDAAALADRLTQAFWGWKYFGSLSEAFVELAKMDKTLMTPGIIDTLERFSSLCPDNDSWNEDIQHSIKTLCELTGLTLHPSVSHPT